MQDVVLPHPGIADLLVQDDALAGGAILQEGNSTMVCEDEDPVRSRKGKFHSPWSSVAPLPSKSFAGATD